MITYNNSIYTITTKHMSYVFTGTDSLQNLYYGERIYGEDLSYLIQERVQSSFDPDLNLEREEYGFWNGASLLESCLKIEYPNIRKLDMKWIGYQIETAGDGVERLSIRYKNSFSDLFVTLFYDVYEAYDIISRHASVENQGEDVKVEILKSASVSLPKLPEYQVTYLIGKWAAEFQVRKQKLSGGAFTIQSRCGNTGPHFNPAYAVDDGSAGERSGSVWFGLLGHTGNWQITFERTTYNNFKITGGMNAFDFLLTLPKGRQVKTPEMIFGYSRDGYGGMSRLLHSFENAFIFPGKQTARVLYNSWEAVCFHVNIENQKELARKAAAIGVELFVIDDGWFGQRNTDKAGLGDWYVNKDKFPDGLSPLISYVKELGMDFGIWVEPESVNPDSDLYRKHPDWIYRFQNQEPVMARNQYTLNISRPEVKAYILGFLTKLLEENPDISFVKWDMNKRITDVSQGFGQEDKELLMKHTETLYAVWEELRASFPEVEMEACSGGGSRVDIGMLKRADQCWPSDNTDAYERLWIQEGFSLFYAPRVMTAWVTDASSRDDKKYTRPYSYRFHSSMMGALGIGADMNRLSKEELSVFQKYIAAYKEIRETIQYGMQYRLSSGRNGNLHAVQYVSRDGLHAVLFQFWQGHIFGREMPFLRLEGLEADAMYHVEGMENPLHGSTLMFAGIECPLSGDFDSCMLRIQKITDRR